MISWLALPERMTGVSSVGVWGGQRFSGLAFIATPLANQVIEHLRCSYSVEQDLYRCASMADLGSSLSVENIVSQIHI